LTWQKYTFKNNSLTSSPTYQFWRFNCPMQEYSASVVVIGSGIGGATTAYALAKRGIDVLIVERGDYLPKEPENWSPQAIFIDKRYKPDEKWLDQRGHEFSPGVHYFVGGNSKVYGAALPRFRERDFGEVAHAEGISPSWPFSYSDLEPYYCEAEALYKVHSQSGIDPTEPPRSKPFPFPVIEHEPYVINLEKRLQKLGLHPFPNAMGIDLGEGGKCIRCSTCDGFACKVDAKSDAQSCALEQALKTGKVKLLTKTKVKKLVRDSVDNRISHLIAEGLEGEFEIHARQFVLSAGAVNSAALMLSSNVGNSSGLVGRNFMMHINSHIATFDPFRRNNLTFQKTLSFNDWYFDGGNGYPLGAVQLIGKVTGLMMKSYAKNVPLFFLKYIAEHSVEFVLMTEDLPDPNNRIEVTSDGRIQVFLTQKGMKTHLTLLKKTKRYLRKAGYKAIFRQPFDISMNSHQCGTLKAGLNPKESVLDQYCKSHDLSNLYVIDGGFFPSSAAMNPALTIAAQALRVVAESGLTKEFI
jgi:choline dehydrogenase-like flavoprotein